MKRRGKCAHETALLPSRPHLPINWFHSSTWHQPLHADEREKKEARGGKEAEVGRQTKQRQKRQAEAALARLTGRKWRQSELGHEWDEIQGGGAGALRGTTLWTEAAPPGRRADCLWIQRASTAEGWEGTTFALVAGDVWARPTGVHLQHVQCYTTPDALQGRSELPPSPSCSAPQQAGPRRPWRQWVMMNDSRPFGDTLLYVWLEDFSRRGSYLSGKSSRSSSDIDKFKSFLCNSGLKLKPR